MAQLLQNQLVGMLEALFKNTDPSFIDDAVAEAKRYSTPEAKQARRNNLEKLSKTQLVGRLESLFEDNHHSLIDDAVVEAKNHLTAEQKQSKRNDLEKLFDAQIATLKDRGTPEHILEILQNQEGAVLAKANEETHGDGNIPFLPVIPLSFRSPYDLMAMVRNGGKVGYTYLNPTRISDVVETPKEPYYIYDVEDDNSTRGKSPEHAEKTFKSQKRSPLTVAEVMALTVHTDVLSKHYVWATGSRYESAVRVPDVSRGDDDRPKLSWDYVNYSNDHWGSASCGSRIYI